MLASLATGEISAVSVAFAHLTFNVLGIAIIWPVEKIRTIPMKVAQQLARISQTNRWIPFVYILLGFYLVPFVVILVLR